MTEPKTHTLDVLDAVITYDVREPESGSTSEPALLLIGSPMGAAGFVTLASHFTDRRVVTYDPRGAERSVKSEPESESTPDQHADDLHRVIGVVGGPVDLFASSGGAVNALAFIARHPEDVRTLVAHEPPASSLLPDREAALAVCRDIRETYLRDGFGPAMAKFIGLVSFVGPITDEYLAQPAPDPAMFGLPTEDDGTRTDPLLAQNIVTGNVYEHDLDAVRAASTNVIVGVSETGAGTLAYRGGVAVAEGIGVEPVVFPGGHGGFSGGEYGQPADKPDEFAAKLREVLADAAAAV